jgi:hypothetical protein
VGSVQGLCTAIRLLWLPEWTYTGSFYWDQVILVFLTLIICGSVALCSPTVVHRYVQISKNFIIPINTPFSNFNFIRLPYPMDYHVHSVAVIFLFVLVCSFLAMYIGLATSYRHTSSTVTGPMLQTLADNLYPDSSFSFKEMISIFFPCFIGIFSGVNNARTLHEPASAIARGSIIAILLSLTAYTALVLLFGSSVIRIELIHNIIIGLELAWPIWWITVPGVLLVGIGAALQCCLIASSVLQSLAASDILPSIARRIYLDHGKCLISKTFLIYILMFYNLIMFEIIVGKVRLKLEHVGL